MSQFNWYNVVLAFGRQEYNSSDHVFNFILPAVSYEGVQLIKIHNVRELCESYNVDYYHAIGRGVFTSTDYDNISSGLSIKDCWYIDISSTVHQVHVNIMYNLAYHDSNIMIRITDSRSSKYIRGVQSGVALRIS